MPFEKLKKIDPVFESIINQYGTPTIPSRVQGFSTMVLLILEQQVSIESAKSTYNKLLENLTEITPNVLNKTPDEMLKNCGVSRQKTNYIKGLAKEIVSEKLNLASFATKNPAEIRNELIKIKGIGHWTIDIYLMFAMKAPDIIPLGDIAVKNTIIELFDIHTPAEMETLSEKWKPYRSFATYLLWHYYLSKRNRKIVY